MGRKRKWVPLDTPFPLLKQRFPRSVKIRPVSKGCGGFPNDCLTCPGGDCIVKDRDKTSRHS